MRPLAASSVQVRTTINVPSEGTIQCVCYTVAESLCRGYGPSTLVVCWLRIDPNLQRSWVRIPSAINGFVRTIEILFDLAVWDRKVRGSVCKRILLSRNVCVLTKIIRGKFRSCGFGSNFCPVEVAKRLKASVHSGLALELAVTTALRIASSDTQRCRWLTAWLVTTSETRPEAASPDMYKADDSITMLSVAQAQLCAQTLEGLLLQTSQRSSIFPFLEETAKELTLHVTDLSTRSRQPCALEQAELCHLYGILTFSGALKRTGLPEFLSASSSAAALQVACDLARTGCYTLVPWADAERLFIRE